MSTQAAPPLSTEPTGASKAVIKNVDMSDEMQAQVIAIVTYAVEQHTVEKDIAASSASVIRSLTQPGTSSSVAISGAMSLTVSPSFLSSDLDAKGVTKSLAESNISLTWVSNIPAFSETRHFIYFYVGVLSFLIWKS